MEGNRDCGGRDRKESVGEGTRSRLTGSARVRFGKEGEVFGSFHLTVVCRCCPACGAVARDLKTFAFAWVTLCVCELDAVLFCARAMLSATLIGVIVFILVSRFPFLRNRQPATPSG